MKRFVYILPPPNITGTLHLGHFFICCYTGIFSRILSLDNIYSGVDHAGTGAVMHGNMLTYQAWHEDKDKTYDEKRWGMLKRFTGLKPQDEDFKFLFEISSITPEVLRQVFEPRAQRDILKSTMYSDLDFYFTLDKDYEDICNKILDSIPRDSIVYPVNYEPHDQLILADSEITTIEKYVRMYKIMFRVCNPTEYIEALNLAVLDGSVKYCENIDTYCIIVHTTRPETIGYDDLIITKHELLNGLRVKNPAHHPFGNLNEILDVRFASNFNWNGPGKFVKLTSLYSDIDYEYVKDNFPMYWSKAQVFFKKFTDVPKTRGYLDHRIVLCEEIHLKTIKLKDGDHWSPIHSYYDYETRVPVSTKTQRFVYKAPYVTQVIEFSKKTKSKAIEKIKNATVEPKRFKESMCAYINDFKDWKITRYHGWGIPYTGCPIIKKWNNLSSCLDTWFSSAIVCICAYHKLGINNIGVITGNDICNIWIARMFLMNALYEQITGIEINLKLVQAIGLVTDENGVKMSKSKGNIINIDYLNEYSPLAVNLFALDSFTRDSTFRFLPNKLKYAEKLVRKVEKVFKLTSNDDSEGTHIFIQLLKYRYKLFFRGCFDILKLKRKVYSLINSVDKFVETTQLNQSSILLLQKIYKKILIDKICPKYTFPNK